MDDSLYKTLKLFAFILAFIFIGWTAYDSIFTGNTPGDHDFNTGENLFEDGKYTEALSAYSDALKENPEHILAIRGRARSLMQLNRYGDALFMYNKAIAMGPDAGATYANRGILHDRTGNYALAIADYEKALALDAELSDGPHWLTRFLRLQSEKPPTIADRANYLRQELAKPKSERVLRVAEEDSKQRSYKH